MLLSTLSHADSFQRDDAKEVVIDTALSLMWQDNYKAEYTEANFDDAKSYCEKLDFAGFTDWYLPSVKELKSILRPENYPRAIHASFQHVVRNYYWSSTPYDDKLAWLVLFNHEDVVQYHKHDRNYVRCVRKTK